MSIFEGSDVTAFRADRLAPVQAMYFPKATFSDDYILQQIQAAEQEIAISLKVFFEETHVFSGGNDPTDEQIAALNGEPWTVEPGYDYDADFFRDERWGYIVTRHIPIISVTSINMVYPNPTSTVFAIPNDWLRLDKKYGHIRLVPASSQFVAPLGAFLMQALGGGSQIPAMIQVEYDAGLGITDSTGIGATENWPHLIDVIYKKALLKIMQGIYQPSSVSGSVDGMSQSLAFKISDYQEQIDFALFGPKGSNGGLWTKIHGAGAGMIGMIA